MQQHYELLYIANSRHTDEQLEKVNGKVVDLLGQFDATVNRQENWGKRRLAYPIKRERFGTYALVEFDLESRKLGEVETKLRLNPDLIRFQLVRSEFKSDEQRRAETERRIESETRQHAREEAVQRAKEPAKVETPTEAETARQKAKEEKKISLEELDEKLEEILKEKNV